MEDQNLYSKKEILEKFKITRQTLNNWRRNGTIKYVKMNDRKFLYELPETKKDNDMKTQLVEMESMNNLLSELGFDNIKVVSGPCFYWNGNCPTIDETAQFMQTGTMSLKNQTFKDILEKNKDKKIMVYKLNKDAARLAIL